MNIKDEMKDVLLVGKEKIGWIGRGTIPTKMSDWGYQLWTNFIYGNYGEVNFTNVKDASEKKQRTFVIFNYTRLLAREFNCSYGYAQKVIVGLFTKDKLASITNEFIEEMKELGK
tara:strand:+ start:125 stop:469 length:345 start_codon:yes stop_codon:yes gene_type:complete